jgi:hypothetical protein
MGRKQTLANPVDKVVSVCPEFSQETPPKDRSGAVPAVLERITVAAGGAGFCAVHAASTISEAPVLARLARSRLRAATLIAVMHGIVPEF